MIEELALAGGVFFTLGYATAHIRGKKKESELSLANKELEIRLQETIKNAEEKISFLKTAENELTKAFQSVSYEALKKNAESFVTLATESFGKANETAKGDIAASKKGIETLLTPMKETLHKLEENIQKVEKERKGEHEALVKQMELMRFAEKELRQETAVLVKALRSPVVRGRWGELQLKRVVELAGMLNHCDFYEQLSYSDEEKKVRPDLIIYLPGSKQIIVDAKTPFEAYLDAMQTDDEQVKIQKMHEHAALLKNHIQQLGRKSYWESVETSPEFVVLFVPSEAIFSAALECDPTLIEYGAKNNVILSTPTTLIGLLRAVAFGWKQEKISKHAEEISELGQELYKRLADMKLHFDRMGKSIASSVEAYNKCVGSMETRVLVSARKLREYGAGSQKIEIDPVEFIEKIPRNTQAPELCLDEE